jgi:hypothetical protein
MSRVSMSVIYLAPVDIFSVRYGTEDLVTMVLDLTLWILVASEQLLKLRLR